MECIDSSVSLEFSPQAPSSCTGLINFLHSPRMFLCILFVIKMELKIHQCFRYCWRVFTQHQGPSASHSALQWVGQGCKRCWEETARRADPSWPEGFATLNSRSCSSIKAQEEVLLFMAFVPVTKAQALPSKWWLEICWLMRSSELILSLICSRVKLCLTY